MDIKILKFLDTFTSYFHNFYRENACTWVFIEGQTVCTFIFIDNRILLFGNKRNFREEFDASNYAQAMMSMFDYIYQFSTAPSIYKSRYHRVYSSWKKTAQVLLEAENEVMDAILN